MHEPFLSPRIGASTADINYHPVDEVTKLLQIREIKIDEEHDTFSRHLPPELLSHIFTIYTETLNSSFDIQRPSAERGPLLFGAVSKLWREVAFDMPQLWNTINIQIDPTLSPLTPSRIKTKIELVKQWLDRSRQLPLCISLQAKGTYTKYLWGPLFSLIRNCAARWHILVLNIFPSLYDAFLNGLTCAPHLHTLKITATSIDKTLLSKPILFYLQTPSLNHLAIMELSMASVAVDWGNLTHFEMDDITVDEFFEILRRAERLTSFELLFVSRSWNEYPIPTTPLTHSALKRLHLGSGMEDYFGRLVFPSLKEVAYKCYSISPVPLNRLILLLNWSRCQLTHFGLSGNLLEADEDDLISLFSAIPTLTHLKLEDLEGRSNGNEGMMTNKLLQKLTHIEGIRAGLLPCLQSLKFRGEQRFSWNCLADFIISRLTDDNSGSNNPITDKMDVDRNLSVYCRNRDSIRLVSFILRGCKQDIDLDTRAHFNHARDAGVSIEIVDELLHKAL